MHTIHSKEDTKVSDKVPSIEHIILLTEKVVNWPTYRRAIPQRERADVKQEIIRKYLDKKDQLAAFFQGKANVDTYYTAVLHRMSCEIIRSGSKNWSHVQNTA